MHEMWFNTRCCVLGLHPTANEDYEEAAAAAVMSQDRLQKTLHAWRQERHACAVDMQA